MNIMMAVNDNAKSDRNGPVIKRIGIKAVNTKGIL